MKKLTAKILETGAKLSEKIAVKSCGATSFIDSYQPVIPESVKKMAAEKNNSKNK